MGLYQLIEDGISGILRCSFPDRFDPVLTEEDPIVQDRMIQCQTRPCSIQFKGKAVICGECKCVLKCSLRIPEKACPLGHFQAVRIEDVKVQRDRGSGIDVGAGNGSGGEG